MERNDLHPGLSNTEMTKQTGESGGWKNALYPWRYLFGALAAVLIVLLLFAEENWRGRATWENYARESAARGEPVTLVAFIPPTVTEEENFAMTPFLAPLYDFARGTQRWQDTKAYAQVQDFAQEFSKASGAVPASKAPRFNCWLAGPTDLAAWAEALRGTGAHSNETRRVSLGSSVEENARVVLDNLAQYNPVIEELRAASRRPFSRFNIRYENDNPAAILLPHLAKIKGLCQLVQLRASAELGTGQNEAAIADIELAADLADSIRNEPLLISHLVRLSCAQFTLRPVADGLATHAWSDAQLTELQHRLEGFDFCAGADRAIRGERAFANSEIEYIRAASNRYQALDGWSGGSGQSDWGVGGLLAAAIPSGWFQLEKVNASKLIEKDFLPVIDVQNRRINPELCRRGEEDIQALSTNRVGMIFHHRLFSALLLPALSRTAEKSAYAQTAMDTAAIGCALERFRLTHGAYPDDLAALEPRIMTRVPQDLVTGKPLIYHRTEDGLYVLYSVGWNQKDDGGSIATTKTGQGVEIKNGDWVWRLPPSK